MAYPTTYRFNVQAMQCHTASCGASPIGAYFRVPFRCEILSFSAIAHLSFTSTDCVVTVALNGTTITSTDSARYITLAVASSEPGLIGTGTPQTKTIAQAGDYLTFTPGKCQWFCYPCHVPGNSQDAITMSFIDKNPSNRLGTNQVIAYDASATTSTAFTGQTQQARVVAGTLSHYKVIVSGSVATTSDPMIPGNWVEYVNVRPGEYVAFIKASGGTAGVATVTECS